MANNQNQDNRGRKSTQGGSSEQHAEAGRQSHKNSNNSGSSSSSSSSGSRSNGR